MCVCVCVCVCVAELHLERHGVVAIKTIDHAYLLWVEVDVVSRQLCLLEVHQSLDDLRHDTGCRCWQQPLDEAALTEYLRAVARQQVKRPPFHVHVEGFVFLQV